MKTTNRPVSNDRLVFSHKGYRVYVGTHRQQIEINVEKDGSIVHTQNLTAEQFISLLMRDARP